MAIPKKDSLLVGWSTNADTRLNATPAIYGTTAAVATQYSAVHDPYIAAMAAVVAARDAGTRSSSLCAVKDAAKKALLDFARPLYKQIQVNPLVLDSDKILLGVHVVDSEPTPIPAPGAAPEITVKSVFGHNVALTILDASHLSKGRPAGVAGCTLFSYVGEEPPPAGVGWRAEGNITRNLITVQFPETVPPGTRVWFTGFWYSQKGLSGPACTPVGSMIGMEGTMPLAA